MNKDEEETRPAKSSPTKSTSSSIGSSRTQTDDESITTSTESDAFEETWTLVTDKNNQQIKAAKEAKEAIAEAFNPERIETLNKSLTKIKDGQKVKDIKQELIGDIAEKGISKENEEDCEGEGEEGIDSDKEHGRKSDHDNTADDELSDGISIISESESAGRTSPNISADRLTNFNLKTTLGENFSKEEMPQIKLNFPIKLASDETDSPSQLVQRRRRRSGSHSSTEKNKKAIKPVDGMSCVSDLPVIVKKGLSGLFYVGLTLAILAFLGKLKMLFWESSPQVSQDLQEKINDIELQNNLMRAEIDILTKQVNYLNSIKDPNYKTPKAAGKGPYQAYQPNESKGKESFKAWTGHDESLKPIEITKRDLKKPFKCSDGNFVEVAGMCIEQKPKQVEEPVTDPLGSILNNVVEDSGDFQDFFKLAETFNQFADNSYEAIRSDPLSPPFAQEGKQRPPFERQENVAPAFEPSRSSEPFKDQKSAANVPHFSGGDPNHKWHTENHQKDFKKFNGKKAFDSDEDDFHRHPKPNFGKPDFNSKERFGHKQKRDSKERFRKDNSKENFSKEKSRNGYRKDNSKERFNQNDSKERFKKANSKERFDKRNSNYPPLNSKERYDSKENRRPKQNSGEKYNNFKKDSDWHEQLMQHREQARQLNNDNQGNANNWFIERGGLREQRRYQ